MVTVNPVDTTLANIAIRVESWMSRLKRRTIAVDGHEFSYLDNDGLFSPVIEDRDPIVMVHGFGGDNLNFVRYARHLTREYRCILPDLPGFGETPAIEGKPYPLDVYVDLLVAFLDCLNLERVHLVGNSFGGHVCFVVAVRHPHRVRSLIQFAPAGLQQHEDHWTYDRLVSGQHPVKVHTPAEFDHLMQTVFVKPPFIPGPLRRVFAAKLIGRQSTYRRIWEDLSPRSDGNPLMEGLLPGISCPTLVVWGDQDRLLPVANAQVYSTHISNSQVEVLTECGHLPMAERPREMAVRTLRFLADIAQTATASQASTQPGRLRRVV